MVCEVGQVVEKAIDVYNPTNQKQRFQIVMPENCYVTGEQNIDIEPHTTYQTVILFKPTEVF